MPAATTKILAAAGPEPAALRNSTDLPCGPAELTAWIHAGNGPTQLAQNCSGKHAAMPATCVLSDREAETYLDD